MVNKWPAIDPGRLRKRVLIQQQSPEVGAIGQVSTIWNTVLTTYASIDDDDTLSSQKILTEGRESHDNGATASRATHTITIRFPRSIRVTPGNRVVFVDQYFSPPIVHYYNVEWMENVQQRNVLLKLLVWEINATE